jgi:chemotaxis protein MotC
MRALRLATLAASIAAAMPVGAAETGKEPVELLRALQLTQDEIAHGSTSAHLSQRELLARIAEQLAQVDERVWKEPRQVRAAITFVLSGGDPAVLRKLAGRAPLEGIEEKLIRGAIAYGEGRNAIAAEALAGIDVRMLDASLAGHFALVQSELIAKSDAKKAVALLDDARLLSPGTLIEEAALRRQAAIVADQGDFERFEALAAHYLRRFPDSVYAATFRQQFASIVASQDFDKQPARLAKFGSTLAGLSPLDQRDISLTIAKEGLLKGKLVIARFAAGNAARLAESGSAEAVRARLYEAAGVVVTDQIEKAVAILNAIDRASLTQEEAELADAAYAVTAEIMRLPAPASGTPPQASVTETAASFRVVERVRSALARSDRLIGEAGQ